MKDIQCNFSLNANRKYKYLTLIYESRRFQISQKKFEL